MELAAYTTEGFLCKICEVESFNFLAPERIKSKADWASLVLKSLNLHLDGTPSSIEVKIRDKNHPLYPLFQHLLLNEKGVKRIVSAAKEHQEIRSQPDIFFTSQQCKSKLFSLFLGEIAIAGAERLYGYTFAKESEELLGAEKVFRQETVPFEFRENVDWKKLTQYIEPHHSLVLVDPYLLDNLSNSTFPDFMQALSNLAARKCYDFSFLGGKERGNKEALARRLRDIVLKEIPHARVSIYSYPFSADFHDRYLITNSCSITAGAGFDVTNRSGETKKPTQWDIKRPWTIEGYGDSAVPFAVTLEKRLKLIKSWIERSKVLIDSGSLNALLS